MGENVNAAKAEMLANGQGHFIPGAQESKSGVWKVVAPPPTHLNLPSCPGVLTAHNSLLDPSLHHICLFVFRLLQHFYAVSLSLALNKRGILFWISHSRSQALFSQMGWELYGRYNWMEHK